MAHGNENSRSLKLGDKGAVSFKLKLCIGFIFGIRLCEMAEYSLYANIFERGYFLDLFNALVGIGIAYAPHSGFKRNVERRDLPRRACAAIESLCIRRMENGGTYIIPDKHGKKLRLSISENQYRSFYSRLTQLHRLVEHGDAVKIRLAFKRFGDRDGAVTVSVRLYDRHQLFFLRNERAYRSEVSAHGVHIYLRPAAEDVHIHTVSSFLQALSCGDHISERGCRDILRLERGSYPCDEFKRVGIVSVDTYAVRLYRNILAVHRCHL